MKKIITRYQGVPSIVEDHVAIIRDDMDLPATGPCLISLGRWQSYGQEYGARVASGDLGLYLLPEDNVELLEGQAHVFARIGYEFPVFKFGQGYSDAVLLRTRYGFKGHLRAFGDIWRDQLFYLARVGFDEFDLKPGKSLEDALAGFNDFSVTYQPSSDQPLPLFARRSA